jgi:hypothetical protein
MRADASTALAAALLIGIQTLLMSVSLGAHAVPGQSDSFGAPLCSQYGSGNGGQPPADRHTLPDCCLSGCALAFGSPLPAAVAPLPLPRMAAPAAYALPDFRPRLQSDGSSIRSRGPPSLV